MNEYHKINTIWKRDERGKIMEGYYSDPAFEYLRDNIWSFTEKVDGTNIRVMWDGKLLRFGGKTDNAQIPVYLCDKLNALFSVDQFVKLYADKPMCLYGEGYGAKIQKGGGNYKSDGVDFVLFDVLIDNWWLRRDDVEDVAVKMGLSIVPTIGCGTLSDMVSMVCCGFKSNWGNFQAEGIVARPFVELRNRAGYRIITKIKVKDFVKNVRTTS